MSNPIYQKGRGSSWPINKSLVECVARNDDCHVGTDNCVWCGKSVHKVKYFSNLKGKDKGSGKAEASGSNVDAPKKNH